MNRVAKLLAAVTATCCLAASTVAAHSAEAPPTKYDRQAAHMRVWHYSTTKVNDLCGRLVSHRNNPYRIARSGVFDACAIGGPAQCIIIVPNKASITKASYDRLYRHEQAHCNGWTH